MGVARKLSRTKTMNENLTNLIGQNITNRDVRAKIEEINWENCFPVIYENGVITGEISTAINRHNFIHPEIFRHHNKLYLKKQFDDEEQEYFHNNIPEFAVSLGLFAVNC